MVVDAFAKAGMKSGMEAWTRLLNTKTRKKSMWLDWMQRNRSNHAQRDEHPALEKGVLRGMNAGILSEASRRGLGTMSIMVEADPRFPDARAAAALIERLNTLLPSIDLPQEPLLAEAELLEAQISALMESAAGAQKSSPSSNAMLYG